MELTILDYILLALIIAIVIHLGFKMFGVKKSCENMTQLEQLGASVNEAVTSVTTNIPQGIIATNKSIVAKISDTSDTNNVSNADSENATIQTDKSFSEESISTVSNISVSSTISNDINGIDANIYQYVEDLVTMKKFTSPEKCNTLSKSEGEEYRENFWGLQDKLNKNTSGGVDMVDRINELYLTDNNELINERGGKISDIYDKLLDTKPVRPEPSFKTCGRSLMNCADTSVMNKISGADNLMLKSGANGKVHTRYDARYEIDGVNNGGVFYNDLEGDDSEIYSELSLQ
jgi:hypothetical protein